MSAAEYLLVPDEPTKPSPAVPGTVGDGVSLGFNGGAASGAAATPPPVPAFPRPAPEASHTVSPALERAASLRRASRGASAGGSSHSPKATCGRTASAYCSALGSHLTLPLASRRLWLREGALCAAAGSLAFIGFLVKLSSADAQHVQATSVLYFLSLLAGTAQVARALDYLLFAALGALSCLGPGLATAYYWGQCFRGVIAGLATVTVGLATYEMILVTPSLADWQRALLVLAGVCLAVALRRLVYRALVSSVMSTSFSRQVRTALQHKVIVSALAAASGAAVAAPLQEADATSTAPSLFEVDPWTLLADGEPRASVSHVARSQLTLRVPAGPGSDATTEVALASPDAARLAGLTAFLRLASGGSHPAGYAALLQAEGTTSSSSSAAFPTATGAPLDATFFGAAASLAPPFNVASALQAAAALPPLRLDAFTAALAAAAPSPPTPAEAALSRSLALYAFGIADADCDGAVSAVDLAELFARAHGTWTNVRATLSGHTTAHRVLELIVSTVFWLVVGFFVLTAFDISLGTVLLPLSTLLIASAFAVGPAINNCISGVIFTLAMHPFDVDDLVIIGTPGNLTSAALAACPPQRVTQVSVLTTTLRGLDGRTLVLPNAALASAAIINLNRSDPVSICVTQRIAASTPPGAVDALRRAIQLYVASHPVVFRPVASVVVAAADASGKALELAIEVSPSQPWQETGRVAHAKSLFLTFLAKTLAALKIAAVDGEGSSGSGASAAQLAGAALEALVADAAAAASHANTGPVDGALRGGLVAMAWEAAASSGSSSSLLG